MVLIGSAAIKHHFPDFPRTPRDRDYASMNGFSPDITAVGKIEYLKNPILRSRYLRSAAGCVCTPNDLYTLKISHLFWDINWEKHMFDVQFLKKKGCVLDDTLFDQLYVYWNQEHSKNKRSDLKMSAEDFFDNALNTPHDYYHTLLNPVPTYTKILKDGAEVEVDEDKFNALTFDEKCSLVYEEIYVMAFERYNKLPYKTAYTKMLKKFIISHAPIWEALFIIENYVQLHKPQFDFIKKLQDAILARLKRNERASF